MNPIDEYINSQEPELRERLSAVRNTIHTAIPEAEERISFRMPTFWKEPYGFTVRFHRHCGEGWNDAFVSNNTSTELIHTSTETDTEIMLTVTERKLISIIRNDPAITISKMAELCGISRGGAQYVLNSLKIKGKVHREGSQKNGRWIVNDP